MSILAEYYRERNERLKTKGFKNLTKDQKDLILEPEEAPENYMCDGEISHKEAFESWKRRLKNSGLSQAQIKLAITLNF